MHYKCKICNKKHKDIPAYHADRPIQYWDVPEDKRASDIILTSDSCVIAKSFFFIHGLIEIPIVETNKNFVWGVWISLKEGNFSIWQDHYEIKKRDHIGPFFGWLSTQLSLYPDTINLKTMAYIRNNGIRPKIILEPTDHPLSKEQQEGISLENALEKVHLLEK
jgi:hypothetical protein